MRPSLSLRFQTKKGSDRGFSDISCHIDGFGRNLTQILRFLILMVVIENYFAYKMDRNRLAVMQSFDEDALSDLLTILMEAHAKIRA